MTKGDFSSWMDQRERTGGADDDGADEGTSFFGVSVPASLTLAGFRGQLSSIHENFSNQLQELSGTLPEAGPLSAAFRQRVTHAIYLLFAAAGFGVLAVFVGLPTLILRPAKFVICMTLSTLCLAGSVIVLQTPSVFVANLVKGASVFKGSSAASSHHDSPLFCCIAGGPAQAAPVVLLLTSLVGTAYVTVVVHRYLAVLAAGALQVMFAFLAPSSSSSLFIVSSPHLLFAGPLTPLLLSLSLSSGAQLLAMLYYLSSFVPGGTKGVEVLLKMGLAVLRTALAPCCFVAKKSEQGLLKTLTS
jgi:hypothetical protein